MTWRALSAGSYTLELQILPDVPPARSPHTPSTPSKRSLALASDVDGDAQHDTDYQTGKSTGKKRGTPGKANDKFQAEEAEKLIEGVEYYGLGAWALILKAYFQAGAFSIHLTVYVVHLYTFAPPPAPPPPPPPPSLSSSASSASSSASSSFSLLLLLLRLCFIPMSALFETPPPYSTNSGRSSVDLKDMWRNMCKAADQPVDFKFRSSYFTPDLLSKVRSVRAEAERWGKQVKAEVTEVTEEKRAA